MHRRPVRACLNLLLVLSLLSMAGPRAVMAMSTGGVGMAHQMHALHGDMQLMTKASTQHAPFHPGEYGHQDQCGFGAHCCLCGVCHAAASSGIVSGLSGTFAVPNTPPFQSLTDLSLPLDPRPPRA